jgi:hypothetical protein
LQVADEIKIKYFQSPLSNVEHVRDSINYHMPPLNLVSELRSKWELGHVLGLHKMPSKRVRQIVAGYIRLVDKAMREYSAARNMLLNFLSDGQVDDYHHAQDHIENCIVTVHRAIAFLEILRRRNLKDGFGKALVPKAKELEILGNSAKTQIREFRNVTQHIADHIASGKVAENIDPDVCLTEESIVLSDQEILYSDLERWIKQLHPLAHRLSAVHLTAANPDGSTQSSHVG